ncbi:MAG TPA: iron-containing alcohol dehydrogenase [Spirochaetia bacterium]
MRHYFYKDFLDMFPPGAGTACACGSIHTTSTRTVIIGGTALEESARWLVGTLGARARAWVLSDENTEAAAGARWKALAEPARIASTILPGHPKPHPTEALVNDLTTKARESSPDVLVAVGSGVISDLVKRVSLLLDVPNWCVATAPSVDAYPSATSALLVNGFHSAVPARVSETIVCDLGVIGKAPREMFLAGAGDLLAKFLAHLDWNVARIVAGEWYCPRVAAIALGSARSALAAAKVLDDDPSEATRTLIDAALCSGFAMQATGNSRSAASAEHMVAHFWETTHAVKVERWDLHGVLAGVASAIMLHVCRRFYGSLESFEPDIPSRLAALDAERPWRETVEEGLRPFMGKVNTEMAGRELGRAELARRLERFRNGKAEILDTARRMLDEVEAAVGMLDGLGFPFDTRPLGIERELILLPLRNVRLLRRRYSTFDLAYELGLEDRLRGAARDYIEKS